MFYDEFVELCNCKGVSRTKACIDCGVSRTAWHKWEKGATPNGNTIHKFAEYFGVSVSRLLGEREQVPAPKGEEYSEKERAIIDAYRNKPEFQSIVDILLGLKGE